MHGVTTDVLAVTYVGFSFAFVGLAHGYSGPVLEEEGRRLEGAGMTRMADVAYLLAGSQGQSAPLPGQVARKDAVAPKSEAPAKPTAASKPDEAGGVLRGGDGRERTPVQIFSEFAPSVVTITVKTPMGDGGGTGFVIDSAGTIATNYHVIEHATGLGVKLMDGAAADEIEVLAENKPADLALLRIKTKGKLVPVVLGDSDRVTVGEKTISIGNPLGLEHTLTDGLVSARRVIEGRKMIQTSTPLSPGNSGGPLFDLRGEVIGVSTAMFHGGRPMHAQNLNLAAPINELRAMIKPEYPGRHKVGEHGPVGGRW
jgi:S1-C subfamily serine protease